MKLVENAVILLLNETINYLENDVTPMSEKLFKPLVIIAILLVNSMFAQQNKKQPNIIWITCEDISPYMATFGDDIINTPNIDKLAEEGVKYNSTYTIAGVCAPSRAGIITGMHPISVGAQHMRTRAIEEKFMPEGVPLYDAVLPENVKAFPEYLRKEGYYTTNNSKEDYQFQAPVTVWDESSSAATYKNRDKNQPFFSIYNIFITHESQVMNYPDNFRVSPESMKAKIPAYYEDSPTVRKDFANLFSHIEMMDDQVGEIIAQLKEDGVYEDSYIFFFSDHGGNLPWMKREILERGTHIPFLVKYPKGENAHAEINDLISSIDFAPSVLSIANIQPPKYMQGKAFLGEFAEDTKRDYVYAARDRMDSEYDRVRSVRDKDFRYIYNFNPEIPKYQDIKYRKGIPTMKEFLDKKEAGEITNPYLADWFEPTKPVEELYNVSEDPDEVHNLADNPEYKDKLEELRRAYQNWVSRVGDLSYMSEPYMVKEYMWNGEGEIPQTKPVQIIQAKEGIYLKEQTPGTSIGYRVVKKSDKEKTELHEVKSWDLEIIFNMKSQGEKIEAPKQFKVYDGEAIKLKKGEQLEINAQRIGYKPYSTLFKN
ncbi:sulfatase family protein [Zunongwangia sp. HGR-M22]|uniref:sulfatase family protein n=1 Tax=Zunongwangia sp. HGR-M22 TaxID=3015168 RepID=UPI0022DCFC28|nr:sulfatase [Zunongwangia sp. HGR-M22]WBL24971.1 sulfatase [Zunongwangia sp. HGR-M22]